MRHDHTSFPEIRPLKKAWSAPAMTGTQLTAAELEFARSSPDNLAVIGRRLKAVGRI